MGINGRNSERKKGRLKMRYMEIEEKYMNRLTKEINVAAKYGWEVVTTIFNGEKYIALLRTESNEPETFDFRCERI